MRPAACSCCSNGLFLVWRFLAFAITVGFFGPMVVNANAGWFYISKYPTILGYVLNTVYFTMLAIEHIRVRNSQTKMRGVENLFLGTAKTREDLMKKAESPSAWHMWKLCNYMGLLCLDYWLVLTIYFWTYVVPGYGLRWTIQVFSYQTIPLVVLLVEFIVNRQWCEVN